MSGVTASLRTARARPAGRGRWWTLARRQVRLVAVCIFFLVAVPSDGYLGASHIAFLVNRAAGTYGFRLAAWETQALAQKARDRKVTADELKGGTFTISNQGAIGGAQFTPIINKPEVAILGLGRSALKPIVRNGKIEVRMMTPLGLSYDHRVIDGGAAARFIVDLVKAMENFEEKLVNI